MLGGRIVDGVESEAGEAAGLDLLPVETVFESGKLLGRPAGRAPGFGDAEVSGYEIRHGRVRRRGGEPVFVGDGSEEGCRVGAVVGTSWHGVMESDGFRRNFLRWVAKERGLDWQPGDESFAAARERRLEKLGDLISEHVNRDALLRLIDDGPPRGLPVVAAQPLSRSASEQTAVTDAPWAQPSPRVNGEVSASITPTFATLGDDEEQRSES